jgi:hypothetical protein
VLHERTSRPGRSARFDWEDGATRVNVGFAANGEAASQAAVEHERLPDPQAAEKAKAYWRERLTALKPSSKPEDRPTTSSVPLRALARKEKLAARSHLDGEIRPPLAERILVRRPRNRIGWC